MATAELACHVRCPACNEEITLDARLQPEMKRMVVGIDMKPVHDHLAEHHTPPTPEPPPSAR